MALNPITLFIACEAFSVYVENEGRVNLDREYQRIVAAGSPMTREDFDAIVAEAEKHGHIFVDDLSGDAVSQNAPAFLN